jgi:hypothetical protein
MRQVGYLQELNRDARSVEHKKRNVDVCLLNIRFNKSALCSGQIAVRVKTECVLCITVIQYEVAKTNW